jgi:hypothetical protein
LLGQAGVVWAGQTTELLRRGLLAGVCSLEQWTPAGRGAPAAGVCQKPAPWRDTNVWSLTFLVVQGLHCLTPPPGGPVERAPRLELLLMQADVIGLGKVARQVDPVSLVGRQGRPQAYVCGEVVLTRLVKPAEGSVTVRVGLAPVDGPREELDALLGREVLWLLRKVAGGEVYRADGAGQRMPAGQIDRVQALLGELESSCCWGHPRAGLQACAALLKADGEAEGGWAQLAFAVKNVSDHLLRVCTHPEKTQLRLVDGDTGQPLPVSPYKWLKMARIRPVSAGDFAALEPGQVLILNQLGARVEPITGVLQPPAELARRIRIELRAEENGSEFGLQDVWTGEVSSGAVDTQPPSSRPAESPAQP